MASIPEEKIAEVRGRTDIVQVIGRFVNLKKAGRAHKGLCPFHQEKTPSFNVNAEKQIFHCFGCHVGGDVFRFLMDFEGKPFPIVVRELAAECGVELPDTRGPEDPGARARRELRAGLVEANERAADVFTAWLGETPNPGASHLEDRGVDAQTAREFGLGYAPLRNDLQRRLSKKGVEPALQEKAGLLARNDRGTYERFRGRLMVPIRTADGKTIAFGARHLEGDHPAKYLNSSESPVYRKSETLYGLDLARTHIRRDEAAVIVEGYFDVIALYQAGVRNAVATCGTALTEDHCRILGRHARDLYLVFDGDVAGVAAASRAQDVVSKVPSLVARVALLPEGEDPDTFVRARGADAFRKLCAEAVPLTEFLIDQALASVGRAVEDKVRAVERVRPLLVAVSDDLTRRLYVKRVAEKLGMDERTLVAHLRQGLRKRAGPDGTVAPKELPPPPAAEEALCLLVLERPSLALVIEPFLGELTHPEVRGLLRGVLVGLQDGRTVDVAGLMEEISDPALKQRWLRHLMGSPEREDGGLDAEAAARWADNHIRRIRVASLERREKETRQRMADEGADPLSIARELNELKAERKRLARAPEAVPQESP